MKYILHTTLRAAFCVMQTINGLNDKTGTVLIILYLHTSDTFVIFSEHKVIIVGLDNAGKTTILYQL